MFTYPEIDRIAIYLGPVKLYWYGFMYALSFLLAWYLAKIRARKLDYKWSNIILDEYIFYCALGTIVGGRLGYILFYDYAVIWEDFWEIFRVWHGGMSFHGGMLGVIIGLVLFARKFHLSYLSVLDFSAPLAPIGITLGRIGNFINGELWGRVTTMPWGMVFPHVDVLPRHPSQIYEALTEGFLLGIILWLYAAKPRARGTIGALFLLGYGMMRFVCEFWREPDAPLDFIISDWLTTGQLLSLPMIIGGICMWWLCVKKTH